MADEQTKRGRPSAEALRQRQIEEILDRHADGEALETICASIKLAPRTFRGWMRKDSKLREAWEQSNNDFVDALFDRYAAITQELASYVPGDADVRGASARVNAMKAAQDGYKNICARLKPGKYAEQKDKQSGITVIFNTDLPMQLGEAEVATIDGDFTVAIDPKKLEAPRARK